MGVGGEEGEDGSNVWTEHLTEELPALMERMMLAILISCLDASCSKVPVLSRFTKLVVKFSSNDRSPKQCQQVGC